jgi:hypothetical protein
MIRATLATMFAMLLILAFGSLKAQDSPSAPTVANEIEKEKAAADVALALKQQREEAQDKLANAYIVIMRLQREVDQMRTQLKLPPYKDATPNAPPK